MSPIAIIVDIILILVSLVLIVAVLMQQGQRQGLGSIGGGAETFFGKNKAKSYEGKLATITKIAAAIFIVLAIVATILTTRNAKTPAAVTPTAAPTVEATLEVATDATDAPVADATDEPVADATIEATVEPTPAPTAE